MTGSGRAWVRWAIICVISGFTPIGREFLLRITALPQTPLEKLEKLEQLRAIENGYTILVGKVEHTCEGIDTPEQYAAFVKRYAEIRGEPYARD